MKTHHYNFPEKTSSQWGRLSHEAMRALTSAAMGPSDAGELLATDDDLSIEGLVPEALAWALDDFEAINWSQYPDEVGLNAPASLHELVSASPNLMTTLNRLYEARQSIISSDEITPAGLNVGETMQLALMPWQAIKDRLTDFDEWVATLRDYQGITLSNDYIPDDFLTAIKSNQPLYRDADNPEHLLTPTEYLDKQMDKSGPWGVMLVQTSEMAGIKRIMGQSAAKMIGHDGSKHLELAGHHIDAMGILEWIALTLQKNPRKLSAGDYSLLPANLTSNKRVVPLGDYGRDGFVRINHRLITAASDGMVVRAAVM